MAGATLAVSLEPPGGSPTGQPTGEVIAPATLAAVTPRYLHSPTRSASIRVWVSCMSFPSMDELATMVAV